MAYTKFATLLFAACFICSLPASKAQHVQFILAADDLVSSSQNINPHARAFARTTQNQTWQPLGSTEFLFDNDEPFWRHVFVQDVVAAEGREWYFEVYDSQENGDILIGTTGTLPANEFLAENDDLLTLPLPPSGSLFIRNCRTFWNLCGETSAASVVRTL